MRVSAFEIPLALPNSSAMNWRTFMFLLSGLYVFPIRARTNIISSKERWRTKAELLTSSSRLMLDLLMQCRSDRAKKKDSSVVHVCLQI